MRITTCFSVLAVITLATSGCAKPAQTQVQDGPPMAVTRGQPSNAPRDPLTSNVSSFHVDIFLVAAPLGSFSKNEEFWKRIDEQCLDVATIDLLQKNGIRVGLAPTAELEHFTKFIDATAPAERLALTGAEVKDAQIEVKQDLPEQTLFYYDRMNRLIGNTFDKCENVMSVSFEPAPRKPGQLRLTLCPMVRTLRKRLQYTPLNDAFEIKFIQPERYYDLNFIADIPADSFLVISPSTSASLRTSVGKAFLIKDGNADQQEQLILVVPRPLGTVSPVGVSTTPKKPSK